MRVQLCLELVLSVGTLLNKGFALGYVTAPLAMDSTFSYFFKRTRNSEKIAESTKPLGTVVK